MEQVSEIEKTCIELRKDIETIETRRKNGLTLDTHVTYKNNPSAEVLFLNGILGLKRWTMRARKAFVLQRYCLGPITEVTNFQAAYKDKFVNWECHHRMETKYPMHITAKLLQNLGLYEMLPPEYLVFMKKTRHVELHRQNKLRTKGLEMWMYDSYLASLN